MTGKPMVLTVDHLAPNPSMDEFITHISEQDRCDFMMPVLEEELHRLVGLTDHLCELCLNRRLPRGLISGVILRGDLLQGISTQSCPVYQGLLAKCLSYEAAKYQMKPMAKKYAQSGRRSRLVSGTADAWEVRREMDWALYEVLDDSIYYLKDRLAVQDTPGPQRPNELKVSLEVKPGALIKSLGRTSGHQLGQISTTSSTIFQGSYMTSEWCVLKRPETELQDWIEGGIGVDGDSGGLVIDEEDNAVYGMLWGRSGDGPATVTIFTPLMEILRDIRDRVGDHASFLGGQQMPNSGDIDPPDLVESVPITVRISEKEQKAPLEESLPPPGIRRQSSAETGHPRPFERYRGGHRTTQSSRQTIPQPEREEEKMEKSQWPGAHTYLRYAVADDQE
jgi:hypothetical protein